MLLSVSSPGAVFITCTPVLSIVVLLVDTLECDLSLSPESSRQHAYRRRHLRSYFTTAAAHADPRTAHSAPPPPPSLRPSTHGARACLFHAHPPGRVHPPGSYSSKQFLIHRGGIRNLCHAYPPPRSRTPTHVRRLLLFHTHPLGNIHPPASY